MQRFWRILALSAVLIGSFYVVSLIPWIGHFTEDRALLTRMAATTPFPARLPEPRARQLGRPKARSLAKSKGANSCLVKTNDPNCTPESMQRVTDLIELGRFEEARDLLLELLLAHPGNVNTLNTLALLFRHRLDDPEKAEHYFRLALEASPDRIDIAHGLGTLFTDSRHLADGLQYFRSLAVRHPDNANLKMTLATLELEDGSHDQAILHLSQALKIRPDTIAAYDILADAQIKGGWPEKAAATLKNLLWIHLERRKEISAARESTKDIDLEIARVRSRIVEISP